MYVQLGGAPNTPGQGPFEFPAAAGILESIRGTGRISNTAAPPEPLEAAPEGQPYSRSGQFPENGPEFRRPSRKFKRTLAGRI